MNSWIADSRLYITWAALVMTALVTTYYGDPYVFAFTALGAAGLSVAIGLVGLVAAHLSTTASATAKAAIIASVVAAAAASAAALAVLRTFKWA
jgi:hypothetical protein